MTDQSAPTVEDRMREITRDLYGTDDLSLFAPGHLEWLQKQAEEG